MPVPPPSMSRPLSETGSDVVTLTVMAAHCNRLGYPAKTMPLNADPFGDGQRPVAGRIDHFDLAVGRGDVVSMLEGAAGQRHVTWISVQAEAGDEHPLLRMSGHAASAVMMSVKSIAVLVIGRTPVRRNKLKERPLRSGRANEEHPHEAVYREAPSIASPQII